VADLVAVGVPEITQLEAFNETPLGNAPPAVIEQVVVAPLLTTVGVIVRRELTVPETVLGEMLMVGNPAPILKENVATGVFVPTLFVAVTE
jgi:hypothetical protein